MPRRINTSVPSSSHPRLRPLVLALSLALGHAAAAGAADEAPEAAVLPVITITGANDQNGYQARDSDSASKLNLTLRETPQSVSVVTRARMDDFRLDNVNDVLANTTGVTVEKVETDRTYYVARGFDIINFQVDGVGTPLVFGNMMGKLDTALFDRVDIVRGANGLAASTGNPSATVNFIRKRPGPALAASAGLTLGSWDTRRLDADVSSPLNASGSIKGRMVVVSQQGDSYLDRYTTRKNVAYGIVEAKLGSDTLLSIGHAWQDNKSSGGMWGALPLYYTDGSPTNYPGGTNTSADWSHWDNTTNGSFAELNHQLGQGWTLKSTLSRNKESSRSALFYVYGTPDKGTGVGLFSYPSAYRSDHTQTLFDIGASGQFNVAGRQIELAFGASWSRSRLDDLSGYGRGIGTPLTAATDFTGAYPQPAFDDHVDGSGYQDVRKTVYAAARFALADKVKLLTGFNATKADSSGLSYGSSKQKSASKTSPYVGLVYDMAPQVSLYTSYTEIFSPQSEQDINGVALDPIMGSSAEVGFKGDLFGGKASFSGAIFRARQNNTAEQAGMNGAKAYYRGIDAESTGAEVELSGELAKGWMASAGFTLLKVEDSQGKATKTYVPRRLLRMSTTYRLPAVPQLKIGANLNWQSDIEREQAPSIVTRQDSYAVLGLMTRYEINRNMSLALHLNNVTDKKYLTSLYWNQAYYAAPRSASVTLNWTY
ncbi:TonB-dependent siderophore receptor [Massilia antarctica]|uniref:TonB-dependent siderophore receptor n=1 Tax=Massilia antarctica TaxID=2765360 RepID=A0AA49A771_9BURK|nr:TonB-dependent siderophore receptor [Massilia antarctica]QPI49098.1 TonB-dependent siderophore receptor [Massilia antarctica]